MTKAERPIGLFDSGIGGTSIWQEIHALLPHEHCLYLADSRYAPYGEKSPEEIIKLSVKNTEYLLEQGCKIIVVACNTATTNAISYLRGNYDVPFIGIEPAIRPAALNTRNKTIGILATQGTLNSTLFHDATQSLARDIKVVEVVGKGLVPLIESGAVTSKETRLLLKEHLAPMTEAQIDYLVLGCSHYPYLIPLIRELISPEIVIIDSGEAVARQTKAVLSRNNLLNTAKDAPDLKFLINAAPDALRSILHAHGGRITISEVDF
ncbi:MAG: glutamate racemase [Flavobacteriaceae bacterium]|nr:glutamate racemase [Flavobacteriaceae bacterium]MDG1962438.1 glutamate racemase [Flavobacteriaceae bacterium]